MIINSRKKREKILNQRNKRVDTDLKRTVFEAGSDEVDRFAWTRVNDAQRQVAAVSSFVAA